jgi:hypothetical protein
LQAIGGGCIFGSLVLIFFALLLFRFPHGRSIVSLLRSLQPSLATWVRQGSS